MRRTGPVLLASGAIAVLALAAVQVARTAVPDPNVEPRVIRIVAKKFVYTPREFVLKKGQPVVFELSTQDFGHGLKVPDLDFRADFVPDQLTTVPLTPRKTGKFEILCDNFCGSGHEEMDGTLTVEE